MSESVSAFCNSSGGELYIGIGEQRLDRSTIRTWQAFVKPEAANGHLQVLEEIFPLGIGYNAEFIKSANIPGCLLHLVMQKAKRIIFATSRVPYVRRGAQNLPVRGDEALRRLRLDKGIETFEDEAVQIPRERLFQSSTLRKFIAGVVPRTGHEEWLQKQNLIAHDYPSVAGVLLFDDEPQALLPKRSATKLYRYTSNREEGDRDTLAFTPITIEGCLYDQIHEAVRQTKILIEGIKRLGTNGLEDVTYPDETP